MKGDEQKESERWRKKERKRQRWEERKRVERADWRKRERERKMRREGREEKIRKERTGSPTGYRVGAGREVRLGGPSAGVGVVRGAVRDLVEAEGGGGHVLVQSVQARV